MADNRTFVHVDETHQTASLLCERCGLEDDVDIRDDLEDGLTLAAICRYIRQDHTEDGGCDRVIDGTLEEMNRILGGEG